MLKHASILGIKVHEPHVLKVLWWVNQIARCGRERKGIKIKIKNKIKNKTKQNKTKKQNYYLLWVDPSIINRSMNKLRGSYFKFPPPRM
jgi:hypothetical protein